MYYISCMKTKTQTSKKMFQSKVDPETSDIFFNYGAVQTSEQYNSQVQQLIKVFENSNSKKVDDSPKQSDYLLCLYNDAIKFLRIVIREDLTPTDLVEDYLHRL